MNEDIGFHIHIPCDDDLIKLFESIGLYGLKKVDVQLIPNDQVTVCPMPDPKDFII